MSRVSSFYTNRRRVVAESSITKVEQPGKIVNNNNAILSVLNCLPNFEILNYVPNVCCKPVPRGPPVLPTTGPILENVYTEKDDDLLNDWRPTPFYSGGSYLSVFQEIFEGGSAATVNPSVVYDDNGDIYDGTSLTPPAPALGYLLDGGSGDSVYRRIVESKNDSIYNTIIDGNGFNFDFSNYILEDGIYIALPTNIFDAGKWDAVFNEIISGGDFSSSEMYYTFDGNQLNIPAFTELLDGGSSITESDIKLIGYTSSVTLDGTLTGLDPPLVLPHTGDPIEYRDMPYLDGGGYDVDEVAILDGNETDIPYGGFYGNYIDKRYDITDGGSYLSVFQEIIDGGTSSGAYEKELDFKAPPRPTMYILEGDETRPFKFEFILNGGSFATESNVIVDGGSPTMPAPPDAPLFDGGYPMADFEYALDGGDGHLTGFIIVDGWYAVQDYYRPIEFTVESYGPPPVLVDTLDGLFARSENTTIVDGGYRVTITAPPPEDTDNIYDAGKYNSEYADVIDGGYKLHVLPVFSETYDDSEIVIDNVYDAGGYNANYPNIIDGGYSILAPPAFTEIYDDSEIVITNVYDAGNYTANYVNVIDGKYNGFITFVGELIFDAGEYTANYIDALDGGNFALDSKYIVEGGYTYFETNQYPNEFEGKIPDKPSFDGGYPGNPALPNAPVIDGGQFTLVNIESNNQFEGKIPDKPSFDGGYPGNPALPGAPVIDGGFSTDVDILSDNVFEGKLPDKPIVDGGYPYDILYEATNIIDDGNIIEDYIFDGGIAITNSNIVLDDKGPSDIVFSSGNDIILPSPPSPEQPPDISGENVGIIAFYASPPRNDILYITANPILEGGYTYDGPGDYIKYTFPPYYIAPTDSNNNVITSVVLDANQPYLDPTDTFLDGSNAEFENPNIIFDGNSDISEQLGYILDAGVYNSESDIIVAGNLHIEGIVEPEYNDIFDGNVDTTIYAYVITDGGSFLSVFQEIIDCGTATSYHDITRDYNNSEKDIPYIFDGNTLFINPFDVLDGDGYLANIKYTLDSDGYVTGNLPILEGNDKIDFIQFDANLNDV